MGNAIQIVTVIFSRFSASYFLCKKYESYSGLNILKMSRIEAAILGFMTSLSQTENEKYAL